MSKNDNYPDFSELFKIDEKDIPAEIIEKDPEQKEVQEPILISQHAVKTLPKPQRKVITKEQKQMLRDPDTEYTLLINESGEYELVPYYEIKTKDSDISAFRFERCGKNYVVCWHKTGSGKITLPVSKDSIICEKALGGERIEILGDDTTATITISDNCYISCTKDITDVF